MKLQIVHNRTADPDGPALFNKKHLTRSTVVVQVPTYDEVIAFVQAHISQVYTWESPLRLYLKTGIAFCHDDDQYNKKVGIKMATERLADKGYRLGYLNFHNDYISVGLSDYSDLEHRGFTTNIEVRIYKDTKKLRILGVRTHGH